MLLATAYSMPYSDNNQADKQTLMKRVLNLLKEKQVEAEVGEVLQKKNSHILPFFQSDGLWWC